LGAAPFHLSACEVLVVGISRLELAAVDRNTRRRQQTHQATQFNKLHADLLDRSPLSLRKSEIRQSSFAQPARVVAALGVCIANISANGGPATAADGAVVLMVFASILRCLRPQIRKMTELT
jgi:hypothetical protein